jgi:hypothetical protein
MNHQNLQEAIEQISTDDKMDSEEIRSQFNLTEEEIKAIKISPLMQTVTPRPTSSCSCCCMQSDN